MVGRYSFATIAAWSLLAAAPALGQGLTDAQKTELGQYFGFGPMQIYKFKPLIGQLRLADLNGDKRLDILFWNPQQSRLEVLYQPDPAAKADVGPAQELERNEVPNRGNLRSEPVPVAYRIASLEVADVTGDGRPDIIFFGEPRELAVLPGKAGGGFGPVESIRAPEGAPRGNMLAVGDFNGDGKKDVALLGEEVLLLFLQKSTGGLAQPIRLPHNLKKLLLMVAADVNGDGRTDLLIGADDDEYGAAVFLQDANGGMGALRRVHVPKLRSITPAAGKNGDDIFCVEFATGRLKQFRWEQQPGNEGMRDWPMAVYAYPGKAEGKQRPYAVGDVNGDGRPDFVAADTDGAQLILLRGAGQGLEPPVAFPGLVKVTDVAIGDVNNDGTNEVLCVSREEKMIGVSHFKDGRLTFPEPLPVQGVPQCVTVGKLTPGEPKNVLAYVSLVEASDAEGKDKKKTTQLIVADGDKPVSTLAIDALEDDAAGLRFADVNQDGRNDLLLFTRFAPLRTFLQKPNGSFEKLAGADTREGLVKEAAPESFALADVNGDGKPEVLLAQKNLARALLVQDGRWTVVDQYNPESTDAQLAGLCALPDQPGSPMLVSYDRKSHELQVFSRRADKTYAVSKTIPVGVFDVTCLTALPGADNKNTVVLGDVPKLAVLTPGAAEFTLVEKQAYETKIKDAFLADCVTGDINHDGVRDVLALETRKANVEVLTTAPDGSLVKALHFQVFQGKRFSGEPERGGEPREAAVGDVTGDGIDDLVLITHDRVLVYPGQ